MARSISFVIEGAFDTRVTITENDDGTLSFHLEALGGGLITDISGIFFDLEDTTATAALSVVADSTTEITAFEADEASVSKLGGDANVNGEVINELGAFDVGVAFGDSGVGTEPVTEASFTLSSSLGDLSLDDLDLADFGLRIHSNNSGDTKIADQSNGVAQNDAFEVDENTSNAATPINLLGNDTNGATNTITAVSDADGDFDAVPGGFARTVVVEHLGLSLVLGTLTVLSNGEAVFSATGADVDKLGHDALKTFNFSYTSTAADGISFATADVTLTIDGQNDQPVSFDVSGSVGEDDLSVTLAFNATDVDLGDTLSFQILSQPTDSGGNQLGSVVNNNDGTFTFLPGDQFQFLDEGETRVMSFTYVAMDDSGVGVGVPPEESDTSVPSTVTITVEGAFDAPITITEEILFQDRNQSLWGEGEAFTIVKDLFLGIDENPPSSTSTILNGFTIIPEICDPTGITDLCTPAVETPDLKLFQDFDFHVGLQALFGMTSGFIDSDLAFEVSFTTPKQVLGGEDVTISSVAEILGTSTLTDDLGFDVIGPNIRFELDLLADIFANVDLKVGSSSLDILSLNFDNTFVETNDPLFNGFERGSNLISFDATEDVNINFGSDVTGGVLDATLSIPDLDADGVLDTTTATITSQAQSDFLAVDFDIDALIGVFVPAFRLLNPSVSASIAGFGGTASLDIADFDLEPVLSLIQDLEMITDTLMFDLFIENNGDQQVADNFLIGNDLTFTTPTGVGDLDLRAELDLTASVDNALSLGFDMDFVMEFLSANFSLEFAGIDITSFGVGPLFTETVPLVDTNTPPLFEQQFDVAFETETLDFTLDLA